MAAEPLALHHSCQKFLSNVKISELQPISMSLVTLLSTQTLQEANEVISRHRIHACPVKLAEGGVDDTVRESIRERLFLGVIDVRCILATIVEALAAAATAEALRDSGRSVLRQRVIGSTASETPVAPVFKATPADTLLEFVQVCLRPLRSPVAQAVVVDSKGHISRIISQLDIVSLLWDNVHTLGPNVHRSLNELGLVSGEVVSVSPAASALLAFRVMHDNALSTVAVVDARGMLVGSLSACDILVLTQPEHFEWLLLPVLDFARAHGRRSAALAEEANATFAAQRAAEERQRQRQQSAGEEGMFMTDAYAAYLAKAEAAERAAAAAAAQAAPTPAAPDPRSPPTQQPQQQPQPAPQPRQQQPHEELSLLPPFPLPPLCIDAQAPLSHALRCLAGHRVRHLFIVNLVTMVPLGVLSLTDVLAILVAGSWL